MPNNQRTGVSTFASRTSPRTDQSFCKANVEKNCFCPRCLPCGILPHCIYFKETKYFDAGTKFTVRASKQPLPLTSVWQYGG